jgi:arylsulfatase A-like enzyme
VDKFKGKFDQGWDKLREDTFKRQKELGVIPSSAELTPRARRRKIRPWWDSLSADEKKLLAHQMEVYAGFLAHTDYEVGRLLEAIRAEGHTDDTAAFYIAGDNGASAEGGAEGRDAVSAEGKRNREYILVATLVSIDLHPILRSLLAVDHDD